MAASKVTITIKTDGREDVVFDVPKKHYDWMVRSAKKEGITIDMFLGRLVKKAHFDTFVKHVN